MAPADQLSRVFSALADPTRRHMVARLTLADATVNELAEPYDVSVQAVSKHLRVLEEAGLVSRRREAQRRPVHLGIHRCSVVRVSAHVSGGRLGHCSRHRSATGISPP